MRGSEGGTLSDDSTRDVWNQSKTAYAVLDRLSQKSEAGPIHRAGWLASAQSSMPIGGSGSFSPSRRSEIRGGESGSKLPHSKRASKLAHSKDRRRVDGEKAPTPEALRQDQDLLWERLLWACLPWERRRPRRLFFIYADGDVGVPGKRRASKLAHSKGRRLVYGEKALTPETLRQDQSLPWENIEVLFGGKKRQLRAKRLTPLRWRAAGHPQSIPLYTPESAKHQAPIGRLAFR